MNIADNCVVSIHYVLTDDKGAEIDSSTGQEPLRYLHGTHSLIPGLERELTGKAPGDHLSSFLRNPASETLCTDCHGPAALWKYNYYHDPVRRLRY